MGRIVMTVVFAALYAWDVWEAFGNLLGLPAFYAVWGIGESVPWLLLWVGLAFPFLVFAITLVLARAEAGLADRFLLFAAGWALIAAVSVSFGAIEQAWRASAIQALPL